MPIGVLILLYVSYPLYTLVRLAFCYKPGYKHTLPNIERACNASFIRENMLVATVLDSFCIDNQVTICGKPVPFGRVMGIYTLLFQDGPQMLIHIIFLIAIHNDVSHSEFTVVLSLAVSSIAIQVSIFNIIMCAPNEFDPVLL